MPEQPPRPSGGPPYWAPGTRIWWRYRRETWTPGEPETINPMTVVRDDADGLVAWLAEGTPVANAVLADGRAIRQADPGTMFTAPRAQGYGTWRGNGILRVAPTGRPWSVWVFWTDDGDLDGWYVNLEAPHRRDDCNVYTSDRVLDVDVDADGKHRRKDEDELLEAVRQGRFTAEQAAEFEADAAEVERVLDAWGPPFCDGWERFAPDPAWPVPQLPPR